MISRINLWDTATNVASTAAITSQVIDQKTAKGNCSLLVVLDGTTPSVNIKQTVSDTELGTYYTPYDADDNDLGKIGTLLTSSTIRRFSVVPAPYMKLTITGSAGNGANTTVKAYLLLQEGKIIGGGA